MFGAERLLSIVEKQAPKTTHAEELFQRISTELTHFLGEHIQDDDMTLLVIKYGERVATPETVEEKETTQWEETEEGKEETVEESGLSAE